MDVGIRMSCWIIRSSGRSLKLPVLSADVSFRGTGDAFHAYQRQTLQILERTVRLSCII